MESRPGARGAIDGIATVDQYQISLPKEFTFFGSKQLPANAEQFAFKRKMDPQKGSAVLSVCVAIDRRVGGINNDLGVALVSYMDGMFKASKLLENMKREKPEMGSIQGLPFCRLKWTATTRTTQLPVKGLAYGAFDGDKSLFLVGMNIGEDAEMHCQMMDAMIATFKKNDARK